MKIDKQQLLIWILEKGRYRVNADLGILESFRPATQEWKEVKPRIQPSGQKQHSIYHEGTGIYVYLHILVWISKNGTYKPGKVVHHIDTIMGNCAISNLKLVTQKKNIKYSLVNRPKTRENDDQIRGEVITKIREKLKDGKNQSAIARELGLKRLAVRYVIKQIESGKVLKFEDRIKLATQPFENRGEIYSTAEDIL